MVIRVWMRTAVRKEITSFGTFLSTLCHEYCHHLDFQHFRVSGFLAYARLLRTFRRALPPCPWHTPETIVLGPPRLLADGALTCLAPIEANFLVSCCTI